MILGMWTVDEYGIANLSPPRTTCDLQARTGPSDASRLQLSSEFLPEGTDLPSLCAHGECIHVSSLSPSGGSMRDILTEGGRPSPTIRKY